MRKLTPKTTTCLYLGEAHQKKAYRLWDLERQRIIFSRDVTFFEDPNEQLEMEQNPESQESDKDQSEEENSIDENDGYSTEEIASEPDDEGGDEKDDDPIELSDRDQQEVMETLDESDSDSDSTLSTESDDDAPLQNRRRSDRPRRPPGEWWKASMVADDPDETCTTEEHQRGSPEDYFAAHAIQGVNVPRNYEEAISGSNKEKWIEAMNDELKSLEVNEVYKPAKLPRGRKAVGCKWVFTIKENANGEIERYKARLVAQGFSQIQGVDFDETYAPVAGVNATQLLLTIANHFDLEMLQVDVKTAYLNGEMREELYMKPPKGLDLDEDMVCKIEKSLYGFKQSAFNWHNKLRERLMEMAFVPIDCEPCMFFREEDGAVILVYVDDMGIAARDRNTLTSIFQDLRKSFDIEDRGDMTDCNFIGFRVKRDRKNRVISLTQERYVDQMLETFNLVNAPIARSPLPSECHIEPFNEGETKTTHPYLQAVGTIIYIATCTRPDIAYAVGVVARHNAKPADRHWELVMRIMRYLKHTRNQGLVIRQHRDAPELAAFSDADWAGDHETRKSTTGSLIKVYGNTVVYKSRKQKSIAQSTQEAEYMAASATAHHLQWAILMFKYLRLEHGRIPFYVDNTSTISALTKGAVTERTKHIDIAYKYARDLHRDEVINVQYMKSEFMPADLLTKAFSKERTQDLMRMIGMEDISTEMDIARNEYPKEEKMDGRKIGKNEKDVDR